ncbi:translation initiation factor IF-2 isoform X2 [Pectinophora gossypiella]|uniref:translation initiation factor IF-2 isoform X2 n=1 Tax=Pectinophora gossypiella TaxID=13191 RepID=UPI00214F2443|nr:translation initiation factor IF-2 isoform X2 [Pectinophora gossypiella]
MSLPSKVNKENFRLLDLSSDEDSEDLQLEIIPSRKKKVTRRERNRGPTAKVSEPNIGAEVQCALRWAVRGTLLLWLLMLTWICAALYDQVSTMRLDISKVSTSSDSVGDALQICHTAAKELRNNATNLSLRLEKLEKEHLELAKRVEKAVGDLAAVTGQLAAAPELRETPQRLDNLQRAVAELGSQINGFDGAINSARKQAVTAATGVEEVKTLVHQLEARTNETIANVSANSRRDDEIKQQLAAVNSTLQGTLDTLRTRIDEMNKPTNTVAPSTAAPAATSPTPAPTSAPSTPTLPPGPPAKPNVLQ